MLGLSRSRNQQGKHGLKGFVIMCIGMVLAFRGRTSSPVASAIPSASVYLWKEFPLLSALIGLFGCRVRQTHRRQSTIVKSNILVKGGYLTGIGRRDPELEDVILGALAGSFLGAIPGVGGSSRRGLPILRR